MENLFLFFSIIFIYFWMKNELGEYLVKDSLHEECLKK